MVNCCVLYIFNIFTLFPPTASPPPLLNLNQSLMLTGLELHHNTTYLRTGKMYVPSKISWAAEVSPRNPMSSKIGPLHMGALYLYAELEISQLTKFKFAY